MLQSCHRIHRRRLGAVARNRANPSSLRGSELAIRAIVLLVILGFPIAIVFAWFLEITPEGIKRTEVADAARQQSRGKAWIYVVVFGAIVSIGLFLLGRYSAATYDAASTIAEPAAIPAKSIAVLPFENLSDDKNTAYLSDGITEEILNALAQIPNLKVAARRSAFQFKGNDLDLRKIGKMLGVAHILDGSLQKAGDQVRINVQLVNVKTVCRRGPRITTANSTTSLLSRTKLPKQSRPNCASSSRAAPGNRSSLTARTIRKRMNFICAD